jgi:integrase
VKTYEKAEMSSDARGYFRWFGGRQCRYGSDRAKATIANAKISLLWQRVTAEGGTWDETTWAIATALRKGEKRIFIDHNPKMSGNESYVHWVDRLAIAYGDLLDILPEAPRNYEAGASEMVEARAKQLQHVEMAYPVPVNRINSSETLHEALDGYIAHLQASEEDESGAGRIRVKRAQFLREHFADFPLARLTLAKMEEMLTYLARRPPRKKADKKPISRDTVRAEIFRLRDFWKWLNRSQEFSWKRPDGWDELKVKIVSFAADNAKLLQAVHIEIYSVEELTTLYQHAYPVLRLFILLGLNCGFSIAEFCSLTPAEINWKENKIKRIRGKSRVYGEWSLWPQTIEGLRWAMGRKERIGANAETLMVSDRGKPLNGKTEGGNKCARIPNLWNKLFGKIQRDIPGFRKLPPKQLRKIGADMVHKVSHGEIAELFLAHGSPVKTDPSANKYSNRAFPELHKATEEVRKQLQPMFEAVLEPFPLRSSEV